MAARTSGFGSARQESRMLRGEFLQPDRPTCADRILPPADRSGASAIGTGQARAPSGRGMAGCDRDRVAASAVGTGQARAPSGRGMAGCDRDRVTASSAVWTGHGRVRWGFGDRESSSRSLSAGRTCAETQEAVRECARKLAGNCSRAYRVLSFRREGEDGPRRDRGQTAGRALAMPEQGAGKCPDRAREGRRRGAESARMWRDERPEQVEGALPDEVGNAGHRPEPVPGQVGQCAGSWTVGSNVRAHCRQRSTPSRAIPARWGGTAITKRGCGSRPPARRRRTR